MRSAWSGGSVQHSKRRERWLTVARVTAGAKNGLESKPSSRKSDKTEACEPEKSCGQLLGAFEAFHFNELLPPLACSAGLRTVAESLSVRVSRPPATARTLAREAGGIAP
jgi:hypothetical protein